MATKRFLVLSFEDGTSARYPLLMSTVLKFEVHYHDNFDSGAALDAARMAYYMAHDETWPDNDSLYAWYDSLVAIDVDEVQVVPAPNGDRPPTEAPLPAPAS